MEKTIFFVLILYYNYDTIMYGNQCTQKRGNIMMLKNDWHVKGIVDADKNGNARIDSMDDSFYDSEFKCRVTCSMMIIEKIWDRAFILPPGCNSLHDTSVIRVTRGNNGLPLFIGKSMTCVDF